MLRASAALNESSREIDSVLLPTSTTVADITESIASNMDKTGATKSTDEPNKSNVQIVNESNASNSDECEKTTSTTSTDQTPLKLSSTNDGKQQSASVDSSSRQPKKKKAVHLLSAPRVETICDDIASTTQDIKRLKHVQVRSNSTGKLYQSSRRVSFPENDKELVTGYLEPADPWACG